MKIAIPYDNGKVFSHFGHTGVFKIYEVEGNEIVSSNMLPTEGCEHCTLANFLKDQNVDVLICGGIGGGATMKLTAAGIKFYSGAAGDADSLVCAFLSGQPIGGSAVTCDCHGHDEDHEGGCHAHRSSD